MATFLHAVASVAIVLLLAAMGYFCGERRWMGPESKAFVSKYLIDLAIPALAIYSLSTNLSRELLAQSGRVLIVPFVSSILLFALSFALGRLLRLPRRRLGVFMVMCALSNAIFIGYPMCYELFGDSGVPYVMLYYTVNTVFTQVFGVALIRRTGEAEARLSWRDALVSLAKTPPIFGVMIGFLLIGLDAKLPSFLLSTLHYVGNTVTPLALLLTGYIIHEIGLRRLRVGRDMALVLLFRFLLSPGLSLLLSHCVGLSGLPCSVLAAEAAMPVVSLSVVAAAEYGADEEFAAEGAALSTLACFVAIPALMLIL